MSWLPCCIAQNQGGTTPTLVPSFPTWTHYLSLPGKDFLSYCPSSFLPLKSVLLSLQKTKVKYSFRFGTILELPLIFTSFPFQSSSIFSLFSFYLYSWGVICYFNFLCNASLSTVSTVFLHSLTSKSVFIADLSLFPFLVSKCFDYLDFKWLTLLCYKRDIVSCGKRHIPCIGVCGLARGRCCPHLSVVVALGMGSFLLPGEGTRKIQSSVVSQRFLPGYI